MKSVNGVSLYAKKTISKIDFRSQIPVVKSNGFHNSHVSLESSPVQSHQLEGGLVVRQVGAGHGGEGAEDGKGQGPIRRSRDSGREDSYHNWRERKMLQYGTLVFNIK